MIIDNVTAYPLSFKIPAQHRVKLGIGQTVKRDAVLVKVEAAELVGWGEAHAARAPTAIAELINTTLRQLVIGMAAHDIDAVWDRVYCMQLKSHGAGAAAVIGLSGIDMALWDIRGNLEQLPLFQLLGGRLQRVAAYAGGISLGFQPLANLLTEVDALLANGFCALKLRLGDTPARDIERLRAVRQHVGESIEILVDVNAAYDIAQIAEIIPALEQCQIAWLEEPFAAHDYKQYIAAKKLGKTPLVAGENHYLRFDFERFADDGAITIWQPDLSKYGGITEALKIASLASEQNITIHPHTSVTSLNMSASIHFLCAIDNAGYFEADASEYNPLRSELCSSGFTSHTDGTVEPLVGPGLGVAVDESRLASFQAIAGSGYV